MGLFPVEEDWEEVWRPAWEEIWRPAVAKTYGEYPNETIACKKASVVDESLWVRPAVCVFLTPAASSGLFRVPPFNCVKYEVFLSDDQRAYVNRELSTERFGDFDLVALGEKRHSAEEREEGRAAYRSGRLSQRVVSRGDYDGEIPF